MSIEFRTLTEFSADLDEFADSPLGFADHVTKLSDVRVTRIAVEKTRTQINSALREHFDAGDIYGTTADGPVTLRLSAASEVVVKRAVESAVVKKTNPLAWADSVTLVPYTAVRSPKGTASPEVDLPEVDPQDSLDTLLALRDALPAVSVLKAAEEEHLDALRRIAVICCWDGQERVFADGWKISLARLQFDAETFKVRHPVLFDRLAVEKSYGGTQRLLVSAVDPAAEEVHA